MDQLQQLLTSLVRSIVSNPDQVFVTVDEIGEVFTYEITMAEGDIRDVIGRKGNTLKALRLICKAIGKKRKSHIVLILPQSGAGS